MCGDDDGKFDMRPECAKAFGGIDATLVAVNTTMKSVGRKLDDFNNSIQSMGERISKQENSNTGLWKEFRTDVQPELKKLPEQFRADIREHANDCPAYGAAMARARGNGKPSNPSPEHKNIFDPGVLKWLLYAGVFAGALLAGVFAASTIVSGISKILPF